MGTFLKRPATVEGRLNGINERIASLEKSIQTKTQNVEEAKRLVGERLGTLAMDETPQNQENYAHSKKALERSSESLADLQQQLKFLNDEKARLEVEMKRVTAADCITRAEQAASNYNGLLEKAVIAVNLLKDLHKQAYAEQEHFHSALKERAASLEALGVMEPTVLKVTLGAGLPNAPSPFTYNIDIPALEHLGKFVGVIQEYAAKLAGWKQYQEQVPNWKERNAADADRPGQVGGVGVVGAPEFGFSNRSMPIIE